MTRRVKHDTGLGGVGDYETHLGLVGQRKIGIGLAEWIDTAADYIHTGIGVNGLAVETAL